jgi:hypothetical protein
MSFNLKEIALGQLSNLSAGYYAPIWVPLATELVYRWVRYNVYRNFKTIETFKVDGIPRRQIQHRIFCVLAGTQIITFFALSRMNKSYLFPACYTLASLVWIHYYRTKETLVPANGTESPYWDSMDGKKLLEL